MLIPKFLIKLHLRIKGTWIWRQKWKILTIAPFVIALGIFLYYTIYRNHAEQQHREFVATWEARGETLDIDSLYPATGLKKDDFFSHTDIQNEINLSYHDRLNSICRLEIKGITTNSSNYSTANGKGTYSMGVGSDIRLWLDPTSLTQTNQQAAKQCLQLLTPFNNRLDGMVAASHRPEAYHDPGIDHTGDIFTSTASMNAMNLLGATKLLSDRITLRLHAGNEAGAKQDMDALIRITNHFCKDHGLIGYLIGAATIQSLEKALWEGLRINGWKDTSLQSFDQHLAQWNEHQRFLHCMRQEMGYSNLLLLRLHNDPDFLNKQYKALFPSTAPKTWEERGQEILEKLKPNGWYLNKGTQQLIIFDEELFYPNGTKCLELSIQQAKKFETISNPIHDAVAALLIGSDDTMGMYGRQISKALKTQATIHNMRTAIALERYRLQHDRYPATLKELVPAFLPQVLEDVITKLPLNYRIKPDGTPLIYSIGYDEKDDNGLPHRNIEKGDWAWMYTPPKGFTYSDFRKR